MNRNPIPRLATRIFDTPLAIQPAKLNAILSVIGPRIANMDAEVPDEIVAAYGAGGQQRDYEVIDGIAVIPIQGTLMKKTSGLMGWSGFSSYESIRAQVEQAMEDGSVRAILFDVDSPGGETHGCFELSEFLFSQRGMKPMWASANDLAASAAYALASAADRVYVTQTGAVGSIGVVAVHCDESGWDAKTGVKYTFIFAGEKKVDGNPHEPLSDSARSDAQEEIYRQYGLFVDAVARNRAVSASAVRDTQAGIVYAGAAVPMLADAVGTFEDAFADLAESLRRPLAFALAESISIAAASAAEKEANMADNAPDLAAAKSDMPKCEEPDEEEIEEAEEELEEEEKEKEMNKAETPQAVSRAEAAIIHNICCAAGFPELSGKFMAEGVSVADVAAKVNELRVQNSDKSQVESHTSGVATKSIEQIEQRAGQLATSMPKSKAYIAALKENPMAYEQYVDQHDEIASSRNRDLQQQYMSEMARYMPRRSQ